MLLKEKLSSLLGTFGVILFNVLFMALIAVPLVTCDFPWWLRIILGLAVYGLRGIGDLLWTGLWVYSFIKILSGAYSTTWMVVYFIALAVFVVVDLIPFIIALFSKKQ